MLLPYAASGRIIFLLGARRQPAHIHSLIPCVKVLLSLAECFLVLLDHGGDRVFALLGWVAPSGGLLSDG